MIHMQKSTGLQTGKDLNLKPQSGELLLISVDNTELNGHRVWLRTRQLPSIV